MIFFRTLFFFAFAISILSFPSSFRRWVHPFTPQKIALEWPAEPQWEMPLETQSEDQIATLLSQPYHYLGKGLQTFAFGSQDGKYVVKLFRFDTCKMPFGQLLLKWGKDLLGINSRERLSLKDRLTKTFRSCILSYQKLSEETGVVWVNLNPKKGQWPSIQVTDRVGRWHTIDTGKCRFLIQKRGELLRPALEKAHAQDPEKFQRMIYSFSNLLKSLEEKGIYNLDPKMASNFGFVEEKAIQIDFGNFTDDPKKALYDSKHYSDRLRGFLGKRFPEGVAILDEAVR